MKGEPEEMPMLRHFSEPGNRQYHNFGGGFDPLFRLTPENDIGGIYANSEETSGAGIRVGSGEIKRDGPSRTAAHRPRNLTNLMY
jgi:hypothetical protein